MKGNKCNLLIVDDHPVLREGLKIIFETENNQYTIDEAENGFVGLNCLKANTYDVILLDLLMPVMDGIAFLENKKRLEDHTKVVLFTTTSEPDILNRANYLGVNDCIQKGASREEIVKRVSDVINNHARNINMSESLTYFNHKTKSPRSENTYGLTKKELYVLSKIIKGKPSKSIAIEMHVTERTVKAHLSNIYRKLDVDSRSEAVATAILRNIISIQPDISLKYNRHDLSTHL